MSDLEWSGRTWSYLGRKWPWVMQNIIKIYITMKYVKKLRLQKSKQQQERMKQRVRLYLSVIIHKKQ